MQTRDISKAILAVSTPDEEEDFIIEELKKLLIKIENIESSILKDIEIKIDKKVDEKVNKSQEKYEEIKNSADLFSKEIKKFIISLEDKIDVSNVDFKRDVRNFKKEISDVSVYLDKINKSHASTKMEILEFMSDVVKDTKKSQKDFLILIEELKKEIEKEIKKPKLGGGSMPFQIAVNGTVATLRYADINLIGSITFVNNNTTKRTDITFAGSGTWYQDEIVATGQTGTSFSLLHTPSSVVFLYKNGQYLVSGASYDYTISGANITLQTSLLATDLLTATYS